MTIRLRQPVMSEIYGRPITSNFAIIDMTGLTLGMFGGRTKKFTKKMSKCMQDNYPENLYRCFIVNAPAIFTGIWAVTKAFMDERTKKKITIMGSNFHAQILEQIDAENLPDFLGGTCKCEGGCLKSNAGPWLEYELVKPWGVKRKDE